MKNDEVLIVSAPERVPMPSAARMFLWFAILVAGTVTVPQVLTTGQTSGLGIWTLALIGISGILWSYRPYFPREVLGTLLPLVLFSGYAILSMTWGGILPPSIQILSVSVAYIGLVLVTARECERDPALANILHRAMDAASIMAAVAYTFVLLKAGRGGDLYIGERPFFLARPFGLFACAAVARQLARWQAGESIGFWIALWLTALVYLSESRTALVVIVMMYPLSYVVRGDRGNILKGVVVAGLGVGALAASIMLYQPMYERFFAYDASLSVGGVSVNATGRTEVWQNLLNDMHGSARFFGRGIGAASQRTDRINPALGHPHNDYLRYLYDLGAFGIWMYLWFMFGSIAMLWKATVRKAREGDPAMVVHMTPLLAMTGFAVAMMTDNPVTYIYLVSPIAIMLGCSMGRLCAERRAAAYAAIDTRYGWESRMRWVDEQQTPSAPVEQEEPRALSRALQLPDGRSQADRDAALARGEPR